jgi:hypothetical protein
MKNPFKPIYIVIFILMLNSGFAEGISYPDSWGKQGLTLESSKTTSVGINYSLVEFSIDDIAIDGTTLKEIHVPGIFLPNNEGAPNLPGTGRYIAIPQGATVSYKIIASRTEVYKNIDIAPAPRIPFDTETGPLEYKKDDGIYSTNAMYPAQNITLSKNAMIRGVDVVMLGITPFQYNPVTRELIVYRDINVEVEFKGGNGHFGDDRLRNRWWEPIIKDAVINPGVLPEIDFNKKDAPTDTPDYEYLIISPDDPVFLSWADSIKTFRTLQGIKTGVVSTTDVGGNTTIAIEDYINNAYNTWDSPPAAVLLLGDYGTSGSTVVSPIYNSYCASDNIYADVDGDHLPDVILARMTAQNATHLETMITKFLDYERTPPTSAYFYDHPITALGWQTERWFQICSETVGGFWKNEQGKDPIRINAVYDGNPNSDPWSTATNTSTVVNYFGPSGLGYIPATPQELGGFSGGTAGDVSNAINNGAFALQHRDHGGETGWGEPGFQSSNIDDLTNSDLPWIFSINCLTGKYNISGECFAEKFHRYTYGGHNSGALGITAASEVSYSFVNDTYVWGLYDNLWPEFMPGETTDPESRGILPAFGNAAGKIFLEQSSWPYNTSNKEVTYNLFHHHGDAFSVLYSEVPQYLTVNHASALLSGASSFVVTSDVGSFIALTVNGAIIGTADGTGSPVSITIPPQNPGDIMVVTITKQNYYRYSSNVDIVPPSGPYVIYNSHSVNDVAGNNNGEADFGEDILLDMTLENLGSSTAYNVVAILICNDPYILVTDEGENYGNINSGATSTISDAFSFTIAEDIPDQYVVNFELEVIGNSDDTWNSYFSIVVNAPELGFGSLLIDDNTGGNGNGRLDPGETVDISIPVSNNGHSLSPLAEANLNSASSWISINSGYMSLGQIDEGNTIDAVFNITCDPLTPIGTSIDLAVDVSADSYGISDTFYLSAGLVLEDWETGNFASFPWTFAGMADWIVTDVNPYEGTYCSQSGVITHYETSEMEVELYVTTADDISFYRKVSSESGWDYLRFYIDGTQQEQWSGSVAWSQVSYPVSVGLHTFKWVYYKDGSVSSGSDCAWVDYIVFPPISPPPDPADIDVDPGSFDVTLAPDGQTTEILTIYNSGETELNYNILIASVTDESGKMSQNLSFGQKQALKNKNDNSNTSSELETGQDNPDSFVLPPIKKYGPQDNKGEETFGSWSGSTWSGSVRDRGNIYHITTATSLTEFRFYMSITATTPMYFVVYESDALQSSFTKIAENYIPSSGTGEGWYSSGAMAVDLEVGKYYYLGTSWSGNATYGRGTESVPLPTSFGTLETGIPGSLAEYPPVTSFTNTYTGTVPYYQTVVTGEPAPVWLVADPTSGSISAPGSFQVDVLFDATDLEEGTYYKNLIISSNDPDEPEVVVPCTLEVSGGIVVNLNINLEGPYSGSEMGTNLNSSGYLPLNQPYDAAPWNYPGTESVSSIPNSNVVDWVLVELRETAGDAATATPATVIERKVGFVLNNGTITGIDGNSPLRFDVEITDNLFVVVYHRNHLGIMTANAVGLSGGEYSYDFTTGEGQVYGGHNAHKEIDTGIWGMVSGDADANGEIDNKDKDDFWEIQNGNTGYLSGDFNLSGEVNLSDKTSKWKDNAGKCSQVIK